MVAMYLRHDQSEEEIMFVVVFFVGDFFWVFFLKVFRYMVLFGVFFFLLILNVLRVRQGLKM